MKLFCKAGLPFILIAVACLFLNTAVAKDFSFSESEKRVEKEKATKKAAETDEIQALLDTPGGATLKNKKTAVVIAERHANGGIVRNQSNYGVMFAEINERLRKLGLKTYTQEEITAQIAQAQTEAVFANNPDAAISAATRLGANFILKGLIASRSHVNPVAQVNEVHITISFTLVDSSGRSVSSVTAESESWSGADTLSTALDLVREKADWVVAKLYNDYCKSAK